MFGSVIRDDFRAQSDIDLLVEFHPGEKRSLFDLVRMGEELEEILGRPVDLVERSALERSRNYLRRKSILESAQPLYEER